MVTNLVSIGQISPTAVYSPKQLAAVLGTGPQTVYNAIRSKALRAAVVNTRGDMRITGAWALERRTATGATGDAVAACRFSRMRATPTYHTPIHWRRAGAYLLHDQPPADTTGDA